MTLGTIQPEKVSATSFGQTSRSKLTPDEPPQLSRLASIAAVLLLYLAYRVGQGMPARYHVYIYRPQAAPIAMAIMLGALLFAPLRRGILKFFEAARHPSWRTAWITAALAALASGIYLYATARRQGTEFILYFHDEHSFMIQLRALLTGRLWLPPIPEPLRDFVESFNMLVYPKYGSIYFPGTALLYAPFMAAGLPWWFGPLVTMSMAIGFLYLLITQLIDGIAGLLAILIALACAQLRVESLMVLSQPAQILFETMLMLAYVRWRRDRAIRWAAAIGLLAGWAGTIRPADALCLVVPIGIAMLLDLWGGAVRRAVFTLVAVGLSASPFLALQAWQNLGMTGKVAEFPSDYYVERTYPASMMGFHRIDWARVPVPALLEKRVSNETFVNGEYARHAPGNIWSEWRDRRLHLTVLGITSNLILLVLLPMGVFGLSNRPRIVFFAAAILFLTFYSCYVFYFVHYAVTIVPMVIFLTLLGGETLARLCPLSWRDGARATIATGIAAIAIVALPEFNPQQHDGYRTPELTPIEHAIAAMPATQRAVVLFHFTPGCEAGEDPVYNTETAWPEDSRILRCHDLSDSRALELYRYLASHGQGDRVIYRYERATGMLTRVGVASALARIQA